MTSIANVNKMTGLSFGQALSILKQGVSVAREGWNGKGMHISLQNVDGHSKMKRPYIYMYPADKMLVPWVASQTDLLADDWETVNV